MEHTTITAKVQVVTSDTDKVLYSTPREKFGLKLQMPQSVYKFGTDKLVNKHGRYFLYIQVTYDVEESNISDICNAVGIDRGTNFVVATYGSNHKSGFVSSKAIKRKRADYYKLRKELPMRQTPSSRRRIKAIGQRKLFYQGCFSPAMM